MEMIFMNFPSRCVFLLFIENALSLLLLLSSSDYESVDLYEKKLAREVFLSVLEY